MLTYIYKRKVKAVPFYVFYIWDIMSVASQKVEKMPAEPKEAPHQLLKGTFHKSLPSPLLLRKRSS